MESINGRGMSTSDALSMESPVESWITGECDAQVMWRVCRYKKTAMKKTEPTMPATGAAHAIHEAVRFHRGSSMT